MSKALARAFLLAAATCAAAWALAFYDQQILIDRALNSPTINVRYSGAKAALVELRLNGISLGTRTVNPAKASGETSFTLDLNALLDGDNRIEVRLYDKTSKLLASETSIVRSESDSTAPAQLTYPRMGQTVNGAVQIKVGFGREMRSAYVSFFIDDQFKAMTNTNPFSFVWDTTRESNGWHELEALVVDETSASFRTRKIRVLVNNPSGNTERVTQPETGTLASGKNVPTPAKTLPKAGSISPAVTAAVANTMAPSVAALIAGNVVVAPVGDRTSVKSGTMPATQTAGARVLMPAVPGVAASSPSTASGTIAVRASKSPKINLSGAAATATIAGMGKISIAKGTRLPADGMLAIYLDSSAVSFDVAPRVVDGVALAPIRHLFEQYGAKVKWEHASKLVDALADGKPIRLRVGDRHALVAGDKIELEMMPFIESGRVIIPLSFVRDSLNVEIEYDPATGHVLITRK
jgi:hypothetical protein